jgi:hypothetical protein
MEKQLIEEISDGVATLPFNRLDRLNALSTPTMEGLLEALPRLARCRRRSDRAGLVGARVPQGPYDVARRASCAPLSWASTNSARRPQTNVTLTFLPFDLIFNENISQTSSLEIFSRLVEFNLGAIANLFTRDRRCLLVLFVNGEVEPCRRHAPLDQRLANFLGGAVDDLGVSVTSTGGALPTTRLRMFAGSRNTRRRWRFWVMHDRDNCIERIFGVLQRLLGEGPLLPRRENASCTERSITNTGRKTGNKFLVATALI